MELRAWYHMIWYGDRIHEGACNFGACGGGLKSPTGLAGPNDVRGISSPSRGRTSNVSISMTDLKWKKKWDVMFA